MMDYYFSETQLLHMPTQYMVHGRLVSPFETAERAHILQAALKACGVTQHKPEIDPMGAILAVHEPHYVDYLRNAHADFMRLANHGPEVLPNVHPYRGANVNFAGRGKPRTTGILGRSGWYVGDLSCAITADSFEAACASAACAVAAAQSVLAGQDASFALCRPPGHHAYADRASGFCFFNNAAIAAQYLRKAYDRVALLDFDTHHGDGSQAIFYSRKDVFFGSVHTDPSAYYPHYVGYAEERGAGKGRGHNLNIPLDYGTDDEGFLAANKALIAAALKRGAQALVVSAGWDAHRDDPLSKQAVTTDGFARIGALYGSLKLPTVIVQEGGYALNRIGECLSAFIGAFRAARTL